MPKGSQSTDVLMEKVTTEKYAQWFKLLTATKPVVSIDDAVKITGGAKAGVSGKLKKCLKLGIAQPAVAQSATGRNTVGYTAA